MKLRVGGYDAYKFTNPYKFFARLLDTKPRRSRKCVGTYTYVTRLDEDTLAFKFGRKWDTEKGKWVDTDKVMCTLNSDDTWTLTIEPNDVEPSHANRFHALTGCSVGWNRRDYGNHENACRVGKGWYRNYPYMKGQQVKAGQLLNTDKLVDRKRKINHEASMPIRRKLKAIYELAPIMVRLLDAHEPDRKAMGWWQSAEKRKEWFDQVDPDNINALDAERVYLVGEATCSRKVQWSYDPNTGSTREWLETVEEHRKRCIVSGLRKLREYVYSKEGVYQYEPV